MFSITNLFFYVEAFFELIVSQVSCKLTCMSLNLTGYMFFLHPKTGFVARILRKEKFLQMRWRLDKPNFEADTDNDIQHFNLSYNDTLATG